MGTNYTISNNIQLDSFKYLDNIVGPERANPRTTKHIAIVG